MHWHAQRMDSGTFALARFAVDTDPPLNNYLVYRVALLECESCMAQQPVERDDVLDVDVDGAGMWPRKRPKLDVDGCGGGGAASSSSSSSSDRCGASGSGEGASAGAGGRGDPGDLSAWLTRHGLTEYRGALDALGAKCVSDMLELDEEDIIKLDLKKLDEKRLRKALAALALQNGVAS